MNQQIYGDILAGLRQGSVVPYLGPGVLTGVIDRVDGSAIPADSDSLILAMTGGQAMAPRLMYEFPRAAMHMENKKGRSFLERFLTKTYGERQWSPSVLHQWLSELQPAYVIDCNRDTQLQRLYQDRPHTLIVGAARIIGTQFRFELYEWQQNHYTAIHQEAINLDLPILFKPLGTPQPKASYIASDADFVDYITELMGGFAVPAPIKHYRVGKQYVFLGMRFNRDTERMVMSDLTYGATEPAGWAFIPGANDKEKRFLARRGIEVISADWQDLITQASPYAEQVA